MDSGADKQTTAYDDYDDPYAMPSAVPKNYNPNKELTDFAKEPEEGKQSPASPYGQPSSHQQPIATKQAVTSQSPTYKANPDQPKVNASASGGAASNLMSRGPPPPPEPPKNYGESRSFSSEKSSRMKEEGMSTCKCTVQ